MRANEFITEGPLSGLAKQFNQKFNKPAAPATPPQPGFASGPQNGPANVWKSNRNPQAPAGANPLQAAQNAGAVPTPAQAPKPKPAGGLSNTMDWLKGQMFRFSGKGGQDGHTAATKNIFLNNFAQEYSQIINSAKRSGMDVPDMKTYVTDYLGNYGWKATPEEIDQIVAGSGNNPRNVANGVYVIAMRNSRGAQQRGQASAQQQGQMTPTTSTGQQVDLSPTTDKMIQVINKMSGSTNSDDLEKISLAAMNKLYGINKTQYAALRKNIVSGQATQPAAPASGEPDSTTQSTYESTTKSRKNLNRTK